MTKTVLTFLWLVASLPLAVIEAVIILTLVALLCINDNAADVFLDLVRPLGPFLFTGQIDRMFAFNGYRGY